jgi:hypothetical protein
MEAAQAIKYGDAEALRANEHQIIYEIELRGGDFSTEHEDYMTYWIASHKDKDVATEMFEVFMNTCCTVFNLDASEEVMDLYAQPALLGAVANENIEILNYIKGYLGKERIVEQMYEEYGEKENWPESLKTFLRL